MSTGAECRFYEKEPRQWFYKLQEWPYGEWPEYDTFGPFDTYTAAQKHLSSNHANPGGWCVDPLPGCEHDLLTAIKYPRKGDADTHTCDRCGDGVKQEAQIK